MIIWALTQESRELPQLCHYRCYSKRGIPSLHTNDSTIEWYCLGGSWSNANSTFHCCWKGGNCHVMSPNSYRRLSMVKALSHTHTPLKTLIFTCSISRKKPLQLQSSKLTNSPSTKTTLQSWFVFVNPSKKSLQVNTRGYPAPQKPIKPDDVFQSVTVSLFVCWFCKSPVNSHMNARRSKHTALK